MLEWAFGKRITPAERLRKNQRMLDKAIRELDQQRVKLEKQEKTLIAQIKQSAQKGQMGACKIQAKDLVRTRRSVAPYALSKAKQSKANVWSTSISTTDISKSFTACGASCKRSRSACRRTAQTSR